MKNEKKSLNNKFKQATKILRVLILSFSIIAFVNPLYASSIDIDSSDSNLEIGDTFSIELNISGLSNASGDSLSAFDVDIYYDDSVFSFIGYNFIDPISGINQLDLPEIGAWAFDGDVLAMGGGVLDAYGISGNSDVILDANQANEFRLLELTFVAISESGASEIGISLNDPFLCMLDSFWGDLSIDYTTPQVSLNVSNNSAVPEPNTILLLGLGLLFFSGLSKKSIK